MTIWKFAKGVEGNLWDSILFGIVAHFWLPAGLRERREQLLLNAGFFLGDEDYDTFWTQIPSLRWFQYQREGMGLESLVYTLIRLEKCERVEQWGFDETSLDGMATLNQWCRILESGELVIITMECAGLLPASSSSMIAEHVRQTW
jgi:hypothetical protein